jgi:hypothetical protein
MLQCSNICTTCRTCKVAFSCFHRNRNVEVVAPISAPILQMVPFPVQLIEVAPSPKYSTIAPVPPFTVKDSCNFQDHIFRSSPTVQFTGKFYTNQFRKSSIPTVSLPLHHKHQHHPHQSQSFPILLHLQYGCQYRSSFHRGKHNFLKQPGE